ncbi:UDP-4-amino-4,6-dideoxy-N-acetyl-beta-L-altrosamine transaminase [Motilimonas cestriensis]|uniref:UDP-4-amino-4, 6-dideoxy-N-acetyl-beta-L-altrosamine transaminase n=1 Tax=Motilimonas cestriensis TaxID=2742685 RepID=A0ABS8WDZ2_9GAMM|nr:UDP-4-amino-4,6-dideoxy-N-acetyl-beta-L-altrosamine transaminase [Motilimonas cestriensis]MCE2595565.1 UDP-4-amino-4,6-dideoxy-N-acetyl-beta-L-altrosamine transaminase [Motilimonas cestriensis]
MLTIPYGKQQITQADIDAVVAVLTSTNLTQGPKVPEFERAVASFCQANHAIAVNSGTSALHIACLSLGLNQGDIVWTSPFSFVASANCALYCGAKVDFVDVELSSGNMDMKALATKLASAKQINQLPKIIIPVHYAGQPCDLASLYQLSQQYGFKIIEDASHALGACYQDKPIGHGQYSDITIFSFHPVKNITCGEGGMALTQCPEIAKKLRMYSSHGITKTDCVNEIHGDWYYEQQLLGFNYRMTDLQAALGCSQMQRLPEFIARRKAIANRYQKVLPKSIGRLTNDPIGESAHHLFPIQIAANKRKHVFDGMRKAGIIVQLHYINIARQPYYQGLGFDPINYPNTETLSQTSFSLPLYVDLTEAQQDFVVATLLELLADD